MIFKKNKYNRYTPLPLDEADVMTSDLGDMVSNIDNTNLDFNHTGGLDELKGKVATVINAMKVKAANAAGLGDKITIKSCLNKLEDLVIIFSNKMRDLAKKHAPQIKRILDTLCNAIMDSIDYIRAEFT